MLLVDWELAGPGSPAFDVGSVLAEYLRFWVASVPIVDPADPGRLVAQAGYPLRRMRPAIQAFWSAYRRASPVRPALRRVVELAAVRVLQSAVERAQESATASAHAITLAQVADHLDHVRQVAGPDHVGLGSDFDGFDHPPVGLEDVSRFPYLFAELIHRGWSDEDLRKLAGRNLLRVFRQAEATAARLRREREPSTRTIEQLDRP